MRHLHPDQMRYLRKEGKTYQAIADIAGVSRQRIHQVINGYANMEKRRAQQRASYHRRSKNVQPNT